MSQNKLTSSPSLHRPLLDGYKPGSNETSTFCANGYVCLNGIEFILIVSSPIGLPFTKILTDLNSTFQVQAIGTMYVL